jgi:hypothetical protein
MTKPRLIRKARYLGDRSALNASVCGLISVEACFVMMTALPFCFDASVGHSLCHQVLTVAPQGSV